MDNSAQKKSWIRRWGFPVITILLLSLLWTSSSWAQTLSLSLGEEGAGPGTIANRVVQLLALTTILSLAPSILMMVTSFTRIIVVLSLLRTALGLQQTPPNTVLMSLAVFLTIFIMTPTFNASWEAGIKPMIEEKIEAVEGFNRAAVPFKEFMLLHTFADDLKLFTDLANAGTGQEASEDSAATKDIPLHAIVPAFMISELKRAFEIGFLIFIPFLIIDMVVASILMSMGMMMLPPVMISIPFKLIFFVLVDGWKLITSSLIQSYAVTTQ
ncbi:MAG TPA: flagellar biosynthetic protein FliP [Rhodospirillaceae bacterium]|nr:flagellar biosynthetic protein FliP [Rhodospirillaceae bacterium]